MIPTSLLVLTLFRADNCTSVGTFDFLGADEVALVQFREFLRSEGCQYLVLSGCGVHHVSLLSVKARRSQLIKLFKEKSGWDLKMRTADGVLRRCRIQK